MQTSSSLSGVINIPLLTNSNDLMNMKTGQARIGLRHPWILESRGQSRLGHGEVLTLPTILNMACPTGWRIGAAKKHSFAVTKPDNGNARIENLNIGLGRDGNAI
jgi:hypothetical protein